MTNKCNAFKIRYGARTNMYGIFSPRACYLSVNVSKSTFCFHGKCSYVPKTHFHISFMAGMNENIRPLIFYCSRRNAYAAAAYKICYAPRAPETHTDLYLPTSAAK